MIARAITKASSSIGDRRAQRKLCPGYFRNVAKAPSQTQPARDRPSKRDIHRVARFVLAHSPWADCFGRLLHRKSVQRADFAMTSRVHRSTRRLWRKSESILAVTMERFGATR